ncbi:hypothetical protein KEM55_001903 [Ascosphaera atra]|nr:hypothetical protein KEM55_001903 [Ascosphaera atra]
MGELAQKEQELSLLQTNLKRLEDELNKRCTAFQQILKHSNAELSQRISKSEYELGLGREELRIANQLNTGLKSQLSKDVGAQMTTGAAAAYKAAPLPSTVTLGHTQKPVYATPLSPITPTTATGKMIAWNHLKFTGDAGQLKCFLNQAQHDFHLYRQYFTSEVQKAAYAMQGFEEDLVPWFQQFYDHDSEDVLNNWETLCNSLIQHQKDFHTYIAKLESLYSAVQWPLEVMPDIFLDGLNQSVCYLMVTSGIDRRNYQLLKTLAIDIQQELDRKCKSLKARKSRSGHRSSVNGASTSSTATFAVGSASAKTSSARASSTTRSIALSSSGPCFVCNQNGHRAAQCPSWRVNAINTQLSELEHNLEEDEESPSSTTPSARHE